MQAAIPSTAPERVSRSSHLRTDGADKHTQALSGRRRTHPATSTLRLWQLLRVKAALCRSLPSSAPSVRPGTPLPLARRLLPRCRKTLTCPLPLPARTTALLTWRLTQRAADCRGEEPVDDAGEDGQAAMPLAYPLQHASRLSLHARTLGVAHQPGEEAGGASGSRYYSSYDPYSSVHFSPNAPTAALVSVPPARRPAAVSVLESGKSLCK